MYLSKFKRFFVRLLIYQIVLLWSLTKLNDIDNHAVDFKNRILRNLNYFRLQTKEIGVTLEDPTIFLVLICFEIISAVLGLFGSLYGNYVSAFLFLISSLIYFNPLISEPQFSLFNIKPELFYNIGIFISILLCNYYPINDNHNKIGNKHIQDEDYQDDNDDENSEEDAEVTTSNKNTNMTKIKPNKKHKR